MLFDETVAVCCEDHTEHTNTLCVWAECGVLVCYIVRYIQLPLC
jgi:hypothetical protein